MLTERLLQFSTVGAEWVLWLLICISILAFAALADRAMLFFRTREKIDELEPRLTAAMLKCDVHAAKQAISRDTFVCNVLRSGIDQLAQGKRDHASIEQAMLGTMARERARFEAHLTPIGTIANNAPFVGLLGTVLGIIQAFVELGKMDTASAAANKVIMSAIGEALIATAVGIIVAVPAVAAFNWFKSGITVRLQQAEAMMRAVLAGVSHYNCADTSRQS